ncbi:MAG TPA: type I glyceraldehyde-3-phosphate dehydrogenase [Solirubrobacteraceae bacterium]|nr:type I glyceraldehyde-3-phosphate dehydrogenase [Solirubrobacteraceae bacterium]
MSARVAINGFGRIGRSALRAAQARGADLELVAINDLTSPSVIAHLLAHDSVLGPFPGSVRALDDAIAINGVTVPVTAERDPAQLPWEELSVDVVLESTGLFTDRAKAAAHLAAGASSVLISAPARDTDLTVVLGVNDDRFDPAAHRIVSNASCTTNCLAPVAKVLHGAIGVKRGVVTTVHAYTSDQRLQDSPHSDPRRARAAAANLVPTSTGAARAVGVVLPELAGRLDGMAIRAPVICGSIVDLTFVSERRTSVEEVNAALRSAAAEPALESILEYSEEPLVSTDIIGNPRSSIVDSQLTSVIDDEFVKVIAWYDNEWGYSNRCVDMLERMVGVPSAAAQLEPQWPPQPAARPANRRRSPSRACRRSRLGPSISTRGSSTPRKLTRRRLTAPP